MRLLPKSIHRCRRYPTKFNSGRDIPAITDTRLMREATTAANEVIRNATDCEVVKKAAPDVYRRLDEAAAKIQTTTGQTSIESLRAQVKRVTDTCGAS